MDNLLPEGYEVLKFLKVSNRGNNQLRYQNRLFGLKNPSKDSWRCITPKCGVSLKLVWPSFDGKNEQGETACHMCGKSYKGINNHITACKKRMKNVLILYNCIHFFIDALHFYILYTLTLLRINKITTASNKPNKNFVTIRPLTCFN
jgi:hypothetical protein